MVAIGVDKKAMKIGVLALQGGFALHQMSLERMNVQTTLVRKPSELRGCAGLIVPGGESTTLLKLLHNIGLVDPIREFAQSHPIFGTCAGSILLAKCVLNHPMEPLGLISASIERNAYGRQVDSFIDYLELKLNGKNTAFEGIFIRAPKIQTVGVDVSVLGLNKLEPSSEETIVLAESERVLISTFHPELTEDNLVHQYFVDKVLKTAN